MDSFGRSSSLVSSIADEGDINEEMMVNTRKEPTIEGIPMDVNNEGQRNVEKRLREDSEEIIEEDDGFTVVNRQAKRILRSNSHNSNYKDNVGSFENNTQQAEYFEVCLTSQTVLPKMIGMAKLLKSQKINDILKIKYKSPYKILITLKNIEETNKILNCQKFTELEFRCQRTDQLSIIYGIVRNIDLEIAEAELVTLFESEADICAVKRLKRLTDDGQWINSEAIRIAFRGTTLPSHIFGYGCRFKVESYLFPVTQCSGCWKYGHMKRFCPTQKIRCPKCGKDHENCEAEKFSCINCKGPHMALHKSCPVYLKERMIRDIMSKNSCSYKIALDIYLKQLKKKGNEATHVNIEVGRIPSPSTSFLHNISYRDALTQQKPLINEINTCMNSSASLEEVNESEESNENSTTSKQHKEKKKKQNKKKKEHTKRYSKEKKPEEQMEKIHKKIGEENPKRTENLSKLRKFYNKVKVVWLADCSLEQKVEEGIKLLLEEIMGYVTSYFKDWDVVSKLFRLFKNG